MAVEMQKTGANVVSQNGREDIVYRIDGMKESIPKLLEIVSDGVFQTRLHDYDLAPKRAAVEGDIELLAQSPELLLNEAVHYRAFGGKTLGNSLVCPPHSVNNITNKTVADFMNHHYTPDRMVLVGTHINHEDLVDMAKDFFCSQFSFYAEEYAQRELEVEKQKGQQKQETVEGNYTSRASAYTGGDHQLAEVREDGKITHAVLAFKGESFKDIKSHYALAVASELLGHGSQLYTGSLTGKSTRLYQNVISQIPQLISAQSFNLAYSDNGLFGVHLVTAGDGSGSNMTRALQKTIDELMMLREINNDKQLDGAKNRVLFGIYSQMDNAVTANEFRYRYGTTSPDAHAEIVRQLSKSDVQSAISKLLASKPTLVTYGNLHNVATTADLSFQ